MGLLYELTYKPTELNNEDKALHLKHSTKFDSKTGRLDSTETLKFGSPAISGVRLWQTLDFLWNNQNDQRALKGSSSLNYQDYHAGLKYEYDAAAMKWKALLSQFILKNTHGDFFLLADIFKKQLTLGCHHRHGERAKHIYELVYDMNRTMRGLCGQPVLLNWVGEYNLNEYATLKSKILLGGDQKVSFSWIHALNQNLTVTFAQYVNLSTIVPCCGTKSKDVPYNFGMCLQWKM